MIWVVTISFPVTISKKKERVYHIYMDAGNVKFTMGYHQDFAHVD